MPEHLTIMPTPIRKGIYIIGSLCYCCITCSLCGTYSHIVQPEQKSKREAVAFKMLVFSYPKDWYNKEMGYTLSLKCL